MNGKREVGKHKLKTLKQIIAKIKIRKSSIKNNKTKR